MRNHKIKKVLIANRGEIALRIKRACDALGIQSAGIYSEADKNSWFVREIGEGALIGAAPASASYLNGAAILNAASKLGCDAVHPGYGFLSENSAFAAETRKQGLIFIGPSAESIALLGDKTRARETVEARGVPCVPGSTGGLSDFELTNAARSIGFPVIVKAAAGGGGRGMRVARSEAELHDALTRARGEAKKFFGSADVFIEKFIVAPRHIEVQICGDTRGNIIHFGTRDCSAQRRHQKIIEEAPAPNLDPKLREAIHTAAVNAARSANYYNAGTAEFLVSGDQFYFLEMNTRIQVEHPVTEEITGQDLVQLQIRIAQGDALPVRQDQVHFTGHAIELRVYAEDPSRDFMPSLGLIEKLEWRSSSRRIRKEFGYSTGDSVSPHYDAMLGKMIVTASTRLEAIDDARRALRTLCIEGLETNCEFLDWLLIQKKFRKAELSIQDIGVEFTPACLDDLRRRGGPRVSDGPLDELKEVRPYLSKVFGAAYSIEVVRRFDGSFVASPFLENDPRPAPPAHRRRSSTWEKAFESLCDEVLEKLPPQDIFT